MYMDTQKPTQVVFHLSDWCSDSIMTWSYQKRDNLISISDILLVKWAGPDNMSVIKVEIGHTSLTLVRTTVRWLWNQHTCLFYSVLGSVETQFPHLYVVQGRNDYCNLGAYDSV